MNTNMSSVLSCFETQSISEKCRILQVLGEKVEHIEKKPGVDIIDWETNLPNFSSFMEVIERFFNCLSEEKLVLLRQQLRMI